jgi:hypothetical protein
MDPVIGARRTTAVIDRVHALETLGDTRDLTSLLRA